VPRSVALVSACAIAHSIARSKAQAFSLISTDEELQHSHFLKLKTHVT